jgi:hypothetical protein
MSAVYHEGKEPKSLDYLAKKLIYLVELNSQRSDFYNSGKACELTKSLFSSLKVIFNELLLPFQRDHKIDFYIDTINTEQFITINLNVLGKSDIDIKLKLDGEKLESFQIVGDPDNEEIEVNKILFTIDLDKNGAPVWITSEKNVVSTANLAEYILKHYIDIAIFLYPAFGAIR